MLPETRQLLLCVSLVLVLPTQASLAGSSETENLIKNNGSDTSDPDSSYSMNESLTEIKGKFETIKRSLLDNLMILMMEHISVAHNISEIVKELDRFESERIKSSQDNRFALDVIETIKKGEFVQADRTIIDEMYDSPSQISRIVHDVYANDNGNFDILHKYFQNSRNESIRHYVLTGLWYQLNANNPMDPFQLITLYNTLVGHGKEVAIETCVRNEIITRATATIMLTLPTKTNEEHVDEVQKLMAALKNSADENLYDDVVQHLITEMYGFYDFTSKDELASDMHTLYVKNILGMPQYVEILVFISEKLRSTGQLDDPASRIMASYLKQINNKHISSMALQKRIRVLRDNLPESIKNIYLADKVRFRAVGYMDYLYSSHIKTPETFLDDGCRTKDFSFIGIDWILRKLPQYELTYEFESAVTAGDYMMNNDYGDTHRTVVKPKRGLINLSVWRIHPHADEVRIVNLYFNKTLCGRYSPWCESDVRLMPYITSNINEINSERCRWVIESN